MIGVDPGPLTQRELVAMGEGRKNDTWNHTSHLLAMLHNANSTRAKKPSDFHPGHRQQVINDPHLAWAALERLANV